MHRMNKVHCITLFCCIIFGPGVSEGNRRAYKMLLVTSLRAIARIRRAQSETQNSQYKLKYRHLLTKYIDQPPTM